MSDYETAYDLLSGDAEEDLRNIENLVEDAVENGQAFTSGSLPDGFESDALDGMTLDLRLGKGMKQVQRSRSNIEKKAIICMESMIRRISA